MPQASTEVFPTPERLAEQQGELRLRNRLSKFVRGDARWKQPLQQALARLLQNDWSAVLFGGVLRDLAVSERVEVPRDADVVVYGPSRQDLENVFGDLVTHKNRFGGLRLRTQGWLIDIWRLQDTWAVKTGLVPAQGIEDLVRTTFFNIEAIAADIHTVKGRPRHVYSSRFFDAITEQTLDVNLEENPYPGLCVVRTILMAIRLDFLLSRRLASYVVKQASKISMTRLIEAQESHYGKIRIDESRIEMVVQSLSDQLARNSVERLRVPATRSEQLALWTYWQPTC